MRATILLCPVICISNHNIYFFPLGTYVCVIGLISGRQKSMSEPMRVCRSSSGGMPARSVVRRWLARRRPRLLVTIAASGFVMTLMLLELNMPPADTVSDEQRTAAPASAGRHTQTAPETEACAGPVRRTASDLDLTAIFPTLNFSVSRAAPPLSANA